MAKIINKKDLIREGRQKKRRIFGRLALLWLIIFFILILELILLLRAPKFLFNQVVIKGASPYEQEKIEETVKLTLFEKCPCLIPQNSIFLYPKKKLSQAIILASPRVGEIVFDRTGQTLNIIVSERQPLALWCQGPRDDRSCFFLDKNGETIAPAPIFSNRVMPEFYSASATAKIHERPLKNLNLSVVISLAKSIEGITNDYLKSHYFLDFIEPYPNGDFIVHFSSPQMIDWYILANEKISPNDLLSNLQALLGSSSFTDDARLNNRLQYIDMRFDKKVFYKFDW